MQDWKTTTGGVLIAVGSGLASLPHPKAMLAAQVLVGLGGLLVGINAPDRR